MLAFSHVMLKWDCSTFNFIRSIPSHGYILLRFPCSFIPTLLCLLFSKQGMVRFTPVSRSFIQKLNEICPSTELRGTIYVTFLFLLSSIHSCGEVCARVCVCVCVCVCFTISFELCSQTQFAQSIDTLYGHEEIAIIGKQHSYIHYKGNKCIYSNTC